MRVTTTTLTEPYREQDVIAPSLHLFSTYRTRQILLPTYGPVRTSILYTSTTGKEDLPLYHDCSSDFVARKTERLLKSGFRTALIHVRIVVYTCTYVGTVQYRMNIYTVYNNKHRTSHMSIRVTVPFNYCI